MFKIVQTRELGRKVPSLTIVPSAWERDGTLFWPPTKKRSLLSKLIRDGNSRPETDWVPQPCLKKRHNFLSYQAADLELSAMLQQSDSEMEATPSSLPEKRLDSRQRKEIGRVPQANFNYLAAQCSNAITDDIELLDEQTNSPSCSSSVEVYPQMITMPNQESILRPNQVFVINEKHNVDTGKKSAVQIDREELFCEEVEVTSENINSQIIENQSTIIENQLKIMEHLSKQDTMLEIICQHITNTQLVPSTSRQALDINGRNTKNAIKSNLLPVDSLKQMEELDLLLLDENVMKQLVESNLHVCGSSGKMNGINCSYTLVDHFFTREFLTLFSWSGGSRKTEGKMPFKIHKNVMKLFHNIISKADSQFSEIDCEHFFKTVIKNAKRRHELSTINEKRRASKGKHRPANLTYKKKKRVEENLEETENENLEETEEDLNAEAAIMNEDSEED